MPPYPRPQMERTEWSSLDGEWDFSIDREGKWATPDQPPFEARIRVPFSPETPASGIGDTGFYRACWYRRQFQADSKLHPGRLLLHFGAVDYAAKVWLNGGLAAVHEGGYTPFTADVTELLQAGGTQNIVVQAWDDPADLSKPTGVAPGLP